MASACYADQVIGNWEGVMDGWTTAHTQGYSSTTGVTLDDESLVIYPDTGWQTLMSDTVSAVGIDIAQLTTPGAYISIDVTWVADEWESDGAEGDIWVKLDEMAIQGEGLGWTQFGMTDTANASYPGSWDPYYWGGPGSTHTRELRYYIPEAITTGLVSPNPTWFQIFLHSNYGTNGGAFISTGGYYLDNMQLVVPEPATIAMLGLGALTLIRRKK